MKKKKNKKKIIETIDKIVLPISIILFALLIMAIIVTITNQCSFEKKAHHPTQEEVDETCYKYRMIPEGYTIDYKEKEIYINCKIGYRPTSQITREKKIYWTKKCCYPTNCPQSKDNPEKCDCIYPVYCYKE